MTVAAEILSDLVTNLEATPAVKNAACNEYGKLRVISATLETTTGYDAADIIAVCKIPAHASIKSIKVFNDDSGNAGEIDVGLYTGSTSQLLTEADADVYANGLDIQAAASTTGVEVAFQNRDIALINNMVYQDAADTLGDFGEYWLCVTCQTAVQNAGTLSFLVTIAVE
jgi:hypothetical protein